jgi:hypothetical protein
MQLREEENVQARLVEPFLRDYGMLITRQVIGTGYFNCHEEMEDSKRTGYSSFFSSCLLYRLPGDWQDHAGSSGVAVLSKQPQSDGKRFVAGFQSFMHPMNVYQENLDVNPSEQDWKQGSVCFYGAFKIPHEIEQYSICG